jgi:pimeloyl-ACP methyl ester carboxylesterase
MVKLTTKFQDLGDVKIAYTEHGTGPALILLHGNSESKAIFSGYQQVHFKAFRTLALDSRGHGETLSQDERYTIEQYANDVIAFCRAKRLERAFVIGYSDGGNIALFLAKKEPELFPKIVAISPNYLVSGTSDGALRLFRAIAWVTRILGKLGLPTRKALLRLDLMLTDIGISAEELGGIRTSMRFLYAEKDLIKEEHILEMVRLVPGATVRKIAGCNHMNILNQQEAIEDMQAYLSA